MQRLLKGLLWFGVVVAVSTTTALAQVTNVFNFDEFGGGQILTNGAFSASIKYTLAPDPTGGVPNWNVLTYTLPFNGTPGDVLIRDPAVNGDPILDVLRFDGQSHLIVYSDNLAGYQTPADTPGPPNPFDPNQYFIDKVHASPTFAYVDYTPMLNDPGYDALMPHYLFFDPGVIPEPGAGLLLLTGAGLFGCWRMTRKRRGCGARMESRPATGCRERSFLHRAPLWVAGLLAVNAGVAGESPAPEVGLAVGQRAPGFALKDQNGKEVSLEGLLKKGPVAVVFYRSADWCRFCKFELIHLQRNVKQFEAVGGQVVGISYDSASAIKKFADSKAITFPLLSDAGSKTIDAYHVRETVPPGPAQGYATHASFVLDQNGIVRARLMDVIYQEQPGVTYLLNALKEAQKPADAAQTPAAEKHHASGQRLEHANPKI